MGVAERSIKTVTSLARAMLLHMAFHWPGQADLTLWSFALNYAIYIWNHLPNKTSRISPIEIFGGTCEGTTEILQRCRVWGCPAYVLAPTLQAGWKEDTEMAPTCPPRSFPQRFSTLHSNTVGLILNPSTGHVSAQYHLVYDELFSTVSTSALRDEASPHYTFLPLDREIKIIFIRLSSTTRGLHLANHLDRHKDGLIFCLI
jgi:hypothetical protein